MKQWVTPPASHNQRRERHTPCRGPAVTSIPSDIAEYTLHYALRAFPYAILQVPNKMRSKLDYGGVV